MFGLIAAAAANHPSSRIRYMLKVSTLSYVTLSYLVLPYTFHLSFLLSCSTLTRLMSLHSTAYPYHTVAWHDMTSHPDTFLHPNSAHATPSDLHTLHCTVLHCCACCGDLESIESYSTHTKSYISLFLRILSPTLVNEAVHSLFSFPLILTLFSLSIALIE